MFDLVRPRRVVARRALARDAFVLTFERRRDVFVPGRHVGVGLPGAESRPYSVFSGTEDPELEVLIRLVPQGRVSPQLARLQPGDLVRVEPPKGRFALDKIQPGERVLLLATGTGIAPYRSLIRSRPELDYQLVHGVRYADEDFGREFADPARRVLCVSGPGERLPPEGVAGRLTHWLHHQAHFSFDRIFLCGNMQMIVQALPLLVDRGFPEDHIHTETYF